MSTNHQAHHRPHNCIGSANHVASITNQTGDNHPLQKLKPVEINAQIIAPPTLDHRHGEATSNPPHDVANGEQETIGSKTTNNQTTHNNNEKVCDFYANPTILSRLILHQKYSVAQRRLHQHPHEAHVWVCRVRRVKQVNKDAMQRDSVPPPRDTSPDTSGDSDTTTNRSNQSTITGPKVQLSTAETGKRSGGGNGNGNSSSNLPFVYNPHTVDNNHDAATPATNGIPTTESTPSPTSSSSASSTTDTTDLVYSYRQLPIHMACQNLGLYGSTSSSSSNTATSGSCSSLKAELESLISALIITYPAGCRHADHAQRYPLHDCLRYGVQRLDVLTLLLTAAPSVVSRATRDAHGHSALDINVALSVAPLRQRERADKLLRKGRVFWEDVRQKAMAQRQRIKKEQAAVAVATAATTATTAAADAMLHRRNKGPSLGSKELDQAVHGSSAPTGATATGASAKAAPAVRRLTRSLSSSLETVWSERTTDFALPRDNSSLVKPMGWKQLEQRCNILEQLLTEQLRQAHTTSTKAVVQDAKPLECNVCTSLQGETRQLQETVESLSRQNQCYQERIVELERNIQDMLWISGSVGIGVGNASVSAITGADVEGGGTVTGTGGRSDGATSASHSTTGNDASEFVVEASHAVSSLSFSDAMTSVPQTPPPPTQATKANQPRGMFGETSIASTILPATSFESQHVVEVVTAAPPTTTTTREQPVATVGGVVSPQRPSHTSARHRSGAQEIVFHPASGTSQPNYRGSINAHPVVGGTERSNFLCRDDDADSDLDSILAEAELQNGSKLSVEVIRAWKAITVDLDDHDEEEEDLDSRQAVTKRDELSGTLKGIEFAGSNGPNDDSLEQFASSPSSRDRPSVCMIVTPIQE